MTKKTFLLAGLSVLCACTLGAAACGSSSTTYTSTLTEISTDSGIAGSSTGSIAKAETTLEVSGDSYTLTKISYGAAQSDSTLIESDKWYTNYTMVFQYTFSGSCTVDGDSITLSVPTSGTKLCYYQYDVHTLYPSRFPIAMTTDDSTEPITLSSSDEDMVYFMGIYIESGYTAVAEQTYTVSGSSITATTATASSSADNTNNDETPDDTSDEDEEEALFEWTGAAGTCTLKCYADGTSKFNYKSTAYDVTEEGTWTWSSWTFTLTTEKGQVFTATMDDSHTLTLNYVADSTSMLTDTFTCASSVWGTVLGTSGSYTPAE